MNQEQNGDPGGQIQDQKKDEALEDAVETAERLLRYVAEHGGSIQGNIEPEIIKTIVSAKRSLSGSGLSKEEESDFWDAYRKLSIATSPVSRESIDATTAKPTRTWRGIRNISAAGRAVRYYQSVAIASLLVLLFFQIYWVSISTLVNTLTKLRADIFVSQQAYNEKSSELKKLLRKRDKRDHQQTIPDAEAALSEEETIDTLIGELDLMKDDPERDDLFDQVEANLQLLRELDIVGRILSHEPPKHVTDVKLERKALENLLDAFPLQTGNIWMQILSLYILPILYGLVGACAYILRTISRELRQRTFTRTLTINLQLRLVLGALAGFSIAWFVGGEDDATIVGNVTPLALAFLAGYSVELLFSLMDTLVEAFTRKSTT